MEPSSDLLSSTVDLTLGTRPQAQPAQIRLSAVGSVGGTERGESKTLVEAALGAENTERQLPGIVLSCVSREAADNLAWTFNETWKQAALGDSPDSFFSSLVTSWTSDNVLLVNLKAEAAEDKLRLMIEPAPWLVQHYKTYIYLIFAEMGDLLAHTQTVRADLEIGNSFWEMLHSSNFLLTLLSWVKFSFKLDIWSGLSERMERLLEKYVPRVETLGILSMWALFSAGKVSLTFNSMNTLPKAIKEMMPTPDVVMSVMNSIRSKLTTDEKKVLEAIAEDTVSPAKLYWWTPCCSLEVQVDIEGLGRVVQTSGN